MNIWVQRIEVSCKIKCEASFWVMRIDGESGDRNSPGGVAASSDTVCVVRSAERWTEETGGRRKLSIFQTASMTLGKNYLCLKKWHSAIVSKGQTIIIRLTGNNGDRCCSLRSEKMSSNIIEWKYRKGSIQKNWGCIGFDKSALWHIFWCESPILGATWGVIKGAGCPQYLCRSPRALSSSSLHWAYYCASSLG